MQDNIDILIIGGGNAALCAALSASENTSETAGKTVANIAILESAPQNLRGGNSQHTRNLRIKHDAPLGVLTNHYSHQTYLDDLLKVTDGQTNHELANLLIDSTTDIYHWMQKNGVNFQNALSGTLSLADTNAHFLGGGKALLNQYYREACKRGVQIYYQAEVIDLELQDNQIKSVTVQYNDGQDDNAQYQLTPKAVIVASGGFESNRDWLAEYWGEAAYNFIIRGTAFNQGKILKSLLAQGVDKIGDGKQCHAVAVDGKAPLYDGGIATRLDCVPFSVVVNQQGKRFYDEGEDLWPKRYAVWGRLVAAQPNQVAYSVIDEKSMGLFMSPLFTPIKADTLEEMAEKLLLPIKEFCDEIRRFNDACGDVSAFHSTTLDGVCTKNLAINKTNWARRIDTPPFYGFHLKTGITFTYMGLKTDRNAQCYRQDVAIDNLWAAGEIMAGNILGKGYLAGIGMSIGTVFGKIAGSEAAKYVK